MLRSTFSRHLRLAREVAGSVRVFRNPLTYMIALRRKGNETVVLKPWRGPQLEIRQNLWDARIVREMFFDRPYLRDVVLPERPTIIDVGGYIGDFTLYAADLLQARVVVYEPTAENFAILQRNIVRNQAGSRVTAVNEAVGEAGTLELNVKVDGLEVHSSSIWYGDAPTRVVKSVTLQDVIATHRLDRVDLLKVDCEGGEYDLVGAASDEALGKVTALVAEIHEAGDRTRELQDALVARLEGAGFQTNVRPMTERTAILRASRV